MHFYRLLASVLIVAALGNVAFAQPSSDELHAYSELFIVFNEPQVVDLNRTTLQATLNSVPIAKLASETLGGEYGETNSPSVTIQMGANVGERKDSSGFGQAGYLTIRFRPNTSQQDVRDFSRKVLAELSSRVAATVGRLQKETHKQQAAYTDRLKQQLDRAMAQHAEKTEVYSQLQDDDVGSAEELREQLKQMRTQQRELKLKLVAAEAREDAIEERIEHLRAAAQSSAEMDAITEQLRLLVELKQQHLERVLVLHKRANAVSQSEVAQAQAELASARIELLRHEQGLQNPVHVNQLASLNEQLSNIVIERAETKQTLEFISRELEKTRESLRQRTDADHALESVHHSRNVLKSRVERLQLRLDSLEHDMPQPTGTVRIVPWNE